MVLGSLQRNPVLTLVPLDMPKVIPKYSVVVRHEPTSLLERITPLLDIRTKYTELGKPRRCSQKRVHHPVVTCKLSLEERMDLKKEATFDAAIRSVDTAKVHQQRLRDRIGKRLPYPTLDVLTEPDTAFNDLTFYNDIEETRALFQHVHFYSDAQLARFKEFEKVIEAVLTRLWPLMEILQEDDAKWEKGITTKTTEEVRSQIWDWHHKMEVLHEGWTSVYERPRLSNARFRRLAGLCKAIGKISFAGLLSNYPTICRQLVALKLEF